jgi:hypothetical protein
MFLFGLYLGKLSLHHLICCMMKVMCRMPMKREADGGVGVKIVEPGFTKALISKTAPSMTSCTGRVLQNLNFKQNNMTKLFGICLCKYRVLSAGYRQVSHLQLPDSQNHHADRWSSNCRLQLHFPKYKLR